MIGIYIYFFRLPVLGSHKILHKAIHILDKAPNIWKDVLIIAFARHLDYYNHYYLIWRILVLSIWWFSLSWLSPPSWFIIFYFCWFILCANYESLRGPYCIKAIGELPRGRAGVPRSRNLLCVLFSVLGVLGFPEECVQVGSLSPESPGSLALKAKYIKRRLPSPEYSGSQAPNPSRITKSLVFLVAKHVLALLVVIEHHKQSKEKQTQSKTKQHEAKPRKPKQPTNHGCS